jgi:hypothetical protein
MMDNRTFIIAGIIVAFLISIVAVHFSSTDPDGLESTMLVIQGQKELTGVAPQNAEIKEDLNGKYSYTSPMADYTLCEKTGSWGKVIAIVIGTIFAFIVVFGLAYGFRITTGPAK